MLLHQILAEDQIKVPLLARERDSAIYELLEKIAPRIADRERIYKAVLEREKVISTGIGNGIAIPHCKSSDCPQFVVALGISSTPIDFRAVDGKGVNLIFLLLGPEDAPNMHIKLLSRISRIMNRPQVRSQLINSTSAPQAWQLIETAEKDFPEN